MRTENREGGLMAPVSEYIKDTCMCNLVYVWVQCFVVMSLCTHTCVADGLAHVVNGVRDLGQIMWEVMA